MTSDFQRDSGAFEARNIDNSNPLPRYRQKLPGLDITMKSESPTASTISLIPSRYSNPLKCRTRHVFALIFIGHIYTMRSLGHLK
jgi:hypothetical protein